MNKSRKLVFVVVIGSVLGGFLGWVFPGKQRLWLGETVLSRGGIASVADQESYTVLPTKNVIKKSTIPFQHHQSLLKEDDDILDFVKKMVKVSLSEKMVLSMLKSSLSPNKKTVLLSLYNKQDGAYSDPEWESLLLSLILDSDSWPELANKASDGLAKGNHEGQWDSSITQALEVLGEGGDGDMVKRTALAFSLWGKDAIEAAQSGALSEPEVTVLTQKHAGLLDQLGRLEAYRTQSESSAKTIYLAAYLKNAPSHEEISRGLSLGMNDPKVLPIDRPSLFLAASEAPILGKTVVLFDHWDKLNSQKQNAETASSLGTIVSIALQKAAFSEGDPRAVQRILAYLLSQNPYNPDDTTDLRITLAILMIHGCGDPLIKKDHCPRLEGNLKLLRTRFVRDGLGKYL